jgi:hypothetical protein
LGFEKTQVETPTLADAGIDKNLANRARKLHSLPQEDFERVIPCENHRMKRSSGAGSDKTFYNCGRKATAAIGVAFCPSKP